MNTLPTTNEDYRHKVVREVFDLLRHDRETRDILRNYLDEWDREELLTVGLPRIMR